MPQVNIGGTGPSRIVDMTPEEAVTYNWGHGKLPTRFEGPATLKLADGTLVRNAADAYWASQPAPVQKLRRLAEPDKTALAYELADAGHLIDVPIMVWDWDPVSTMLTRHSAGFTWVPSALMQPVAVGPGLTFPGKPSYDPHNPPPGAIMVSTKFAVGFELTGAWQWGIPIEIF